MPVLPTSTYIPPILLKNRHVQTIYPALCRKVKGIQYKRERITLPDSDFLDLDWSFTNQDTENQNTTSQSHSLCILFHGLEGHTERSYMRGMARVFNKDGWDALACNFRGCSGESNLLMRSYHAGATEDLEAVVNHVLTNYNYERLILIGFSLGGNLVLKYLGEQGSQVPSQLSGAAAFSVPCDLEASVDIMSAPENNFYMRRFMRLLKAKMYRKAEDFPDLPHVEKLKDMTTFHEFDNYFTAPLHGYEDAQAYWRNASCVHGLSDIKIPTLLVNAADDPFLVPACFPEDKAQKNPDLFLEIPQRGGHIGFVDWKNDGMLWSERRAVQFFSHIFA